MTKKFMKLVRERWAAVYAAPVVVLPYEKEEDDGSIDSDPKVSDDDDANNSYGIRTNLKNPKS